MNVPEFKIIIEPPYTPDEVPDKKKISECLDNIAEAVAALDYCSVSYIFGNLNDIRIACGIEEENNE